MSNPLRIVIAVVVLGLAAAGIAVKTAHRAQPETSAAARAASNATQEAKSASVSMPQEEAGESERGQGQTNPAACEVKGEVCEPVTGSKTTTKTEKPAEEGLAKPSNTQKAEQQPSAQPAQNGKLPKVIDLGKGTCIPCKKMLPILTELQTEYKGRAVIEIIDLREQPEAAQVYNLRLIPTQIFFDSAGKEVWRHEGFLPKEAIIAKLKELGVA
jgi:thioredoxin 1